MNVQQIVVKNKKVKDNINKQQNRIKKYIGGVSKKARKKDRKRNNSLRLWQKVSILAEKWINEYTGNKDINTNLNRIQAYYKVCTDPWNIKFAKHGYLNLKTYEKRYNETVLTLQQQLINRIMMSVPLNFTFLLWKLVTKYDICVCEPHEKITYLKIYLSYTGCLVIDIIPTKGFRLKVITPTYIDTSCEYILPLERMADLFNIINLIKFQSYLMLS